MKYPYLSSFVKFGLDTYMMNMITFYELKEYSNKAHIIRDNWDLFQEILKENPSEGYMFEWSELGVDIWKINTDPDQPGLRVAITPADKRKMIDKYVFELNKELMNE